MIEWKTETGEIVTAKTKSEARAILKKKNGKLPPNFKLEKNSETLSCKMISNEKKRIL